MTKSAHGVWASPSHTLKQSPRQTCQLGGLLTNLSLLTFMSDTAMSTAIWALSSVYKIRLISDELWKQHSHNLVLNSSAAAGGTHAILYVIRGCEKKGKEPSPALHPSLE